MNRISKNLLGFSVLLLSAISHSSVTITCKSGCVQSDLDNSLNPLIRSSISDSVVLEFVVENYQDRQSLNIYFGNPELDSQLSKVEDIGADFDGDKLVFNREFGPEDLGLGAFITVVTEGRRNEEILSWKSWRLMTTDSLELRQRSLRSTNWELDVTPSALRVKTPEGSFPKSALGDNAQAWWSLSNRSEVGSYEDLDIDGRNNGVAGIGVSISQPRPSKPGSKKYLEMLGIEGHLTSFEDMEFFESYDVELDLDGEQRLLKYYYSVITFHTNATAREINRSDISGGQASSRVRIAHETSARIEDPDHPLLWNSYSEAEYGNDRHLLELLEESAADGDGIVPGLTDVNRNPGDSGVAVYTVAFDTDIRPWLNEENYEVGFVAIDVLASRAGYGVVRSQSGVDGDSNLGIICRMISCEEEEYEFDFYNLPRGYDVAIPQASVSTQDGSIPILVAEDFKYATRNSGLFRSTENIPSASSIRFSLSAALRSGALIFRDSPHALASFFGVKRIESFTPINSYAQFVVRFAVVMNEIPPLVTNDSDIAPSEDDFSWIIPVVKPKLIWQKILDFLKNISWFGALIGIAVLFIFLAPFQVLIASICRFLASLLNSISSRIENRTNRRSQARH